MARGHTRISEIEFFRTRRVRVELPLILVSLVISTVLTMPAGTGAHNGSGALRPRADGNQQPLAPRHPCIGEWAGTLVASTGHRALGTVSVTNSTQDCGTFVERWLPNMSCHYTLSSCTFEGSTIRAGARSRSGPIMGGCNPVIVTFTCRSDRLSFHEIGPTSTVSATMVRQSRP